MVALAQGTLSPTFKLKAADRSVYDLVVALKKTQVVLVAFLKVTCPVCHLAFPYLERLHRSYPNLTIWGISQDDSDATKAFARMFGLTFPLLLDDELETTVHYNLTHVPSIFLIESDLTIAESIVGWVKTDLERLNTTLAHHAGLPAVPLFTDADEVPTIKPGCVSKQQA